MAEEHHVTGDTSNARGGSAGRRVQREPYVGEGADGCYRSAQIDREEADGLNLDDPRHAERLASAEKWEQQAELLTQAAGVRRPETERHGITDSNAAAGFGMSR